MHNFSSLLNIIIHISDGLTVHHQESTTVHTASGICHTGSLTTCQRAQDGTETCRVIFNKLEKLCIQLVLLQKYITMHSPMNVKFVKIHVYITSKHVARINLKLLWRHMPDIGVSESYTAKLDVWSPLMQYARAEKQAINQAWHSASQRVQ